MSRSGYSDDYDEDGTGGLWRGAVARSIQGKRGQVALRELAAAMDAMPVRQLAAESLVTADGAFCTLGVLGSVRGMDMSTIDPDDWDAVAAAFGIAPAMVREIVYLNDESVCEHEWVDVEICGPMRPHYPEYGRHVQFVCVERLDVAGRRWQYMRDWVAKNIDSAKAAT